MLRTALRPWLRSVGLVLTIAGCSSPPSDSPEGAGGRAAAPSATALPIADTTVLRLAAEASAQFDTAGAVASGPRSCESEPSAEPSQRCQLTLTVRGDVARFAPNDVPGRHAVLAAVRNSGDLREVRTGIPGGVTAFLLVEQGSEGRARAWYFSVDHGDGGRVVVIRETAYSTCEHQHPTDGKPLAAWRHCADGPTSGASRTPPTDDASDRPAWFPCGVSCCVER